MFSHTVDAFVSQLSPSSPTLPGGPGSVGGSLSLNSSPFYHEPSAPTTPPAKDIPELQIRTFTKLKRHNITPLVDESIRLANCAGSREYDQASEERLKNDLLQVLISTGSCLPDSKSRGHLGVSDNADPELDLDFAAKFLSLTITSGEPISILLEHRLLGRLGESLLGAKSEDDALIPITLDLCDLPLEATGIVCGVAGRLAQGSVEENGTTHTHEDEHSAEASDGDDLAAALASSSLFLLGEPVEISFLSTARAGTVIVRATQLDKALGALEYGMKRVADKE